MFAMRLLLSVFLCVNVLSITKKRRIEELNRIKKYELIYINTESFDSLNVIEFDAFGQSYKIKLEPNDGVNPSKLYHTNGIHGDKENQYFTSLDAPCHYFGKVINVKQETDDRTNNRAALSLCDKRGVRGSVHLNGETLHIKPSKYWLDLDNIKDHVHDLKDEHLIYKFSDFDTTGIPNAEGVHLDKAEILDIVENKRKKQDEVEQELIHKATDDDVVDDGTRRRLYNGGSNKVEMYLFSDPIRSTNIRTDIGTNWYQELVATYGDYMNQVSNEYATMNWGNTIGQITVHWVELEVAFEFSGIYASLYPTMSYSNCNNPYDCKIDGSGYLGKFMNFLKNYKDQSTFDNAQCLSDMDFLDAAGWGYVGGVCKTTSVSNIALLWGDPWAIRSIAHELGHNFGASHDGQPGAGQNCDANAGLMGYGNGESFSSCSWTSISNYFSQNGGLTCLGNGVRSFESNYGGGTNPVVQPTPAPVAPQPQPTPQPTMPPNNGGGDLSCLGIENFEMSSGIDFNGYWTYGGEFNNAAYYTKDGYYFFLSVDYSVYIASSTLGDTGAFMYCPASNVNSCNGNVYYIDSSNSWVKDTDANFYDCDGGGNNGGGNNGGGSCQYQSCLGVWGMEPQGNGVSFDGGWSPAGCHGGESIYTFTTQGTTYYMYLNENYNYWFISAELGSDSPSAYCPSAVLASCSHKWYTIQNNAWTQDSECWIYDCAALNNAFTAEAGIECTFIHKYNDKLCLQHDYFDREENDGYTEWKRYNKTCSYNRPIYHFTIYDEEITANINDTELESTVVNTTYYLHYKDVVIYTDSNETSPQWIISTDSVSEVYYAKCEEADLLDCSGKWEVQDTEQSDQILYFLSNETLFYNEDCSTYFGSITPDDSNNVPTIILLSALAIVVILVIIVVVRMVFCKKSKGKAYFKENVDNKQVEIPAADQDDEEPQEIEVDVEIEDNDNQSYALTNQTVTYQ